MENIESLRVCNVKCATERRSSVRNTQRYKLFDDDDENEDEEDEND